MKTYRFKITKGDRKSVFVSVKAKDSYSAWILVMPDAWQIISEVKKIELHSVT